MHTGISGQLARCRARDRFTDAVCGSSLTVAGQHRPLSSCGALARKPRQDRRPAVLPVGCPGHRGHRAPGTGMPLLLPGAIRTGTGLAVRGARATFRPRNQRSGDCRSARGAPGISRNRNAWRLGRPRIADPADGDLAGRIALRAACPQERSFALPPQARQRPGLSPLGIEKGGCDDRY